MPTSRLHSSARRGFARGAVCVLLAVAGLTGSATLAAAEDTAAWEVEPSAGEYGSSRDDFHYAVSAGEQVSDALTVTNTSQAPLDLDLYAADAFTTDSGDLDLRTADDPATGVASWLRLATGQLTLQPGAAAEVPFAIDVPAAAVSGDHLGGIVVSRTEQGNGDQVERRVALRVQLRVGTDFAPQLSVEGVGIGVSGNPFGSADATVTYTVRNTGNAILGGEQQVAVSGLFGLGRVEGEAVPDLPQLLPGETWQVSAPVPGVARSGVLTASVTVTPLLTDAAGSTGPLPSTEAGGTGWATPWTVLVAIAAVAVLVVLFTRRGRGRPAGTASSGEESEGESVRPDQDARENTTVGPTRVPGRVTRVARVVAAIAVLGGSTAILGAPAARAHGFSSVVYTDMGSPEAGVVRATLDLEYDLLVVSAADSEHAPDLFELGTSLFQTGDEAQALNKFPDPVVAYVTKRFSVTTGDAGACTPSRTGDFTTHIRDGVPYATLVLDYACPPTAAHEVSSALFPDDEGYVKGTKTIVTYSLDDLDGSAALDAANPSFSIEQTWQQRFTEFFLLGAEHLLTGIDHILFLLALIVGSRRLRDIVLAATTFTVAHSVTFLLAATGVVHPPAWFVEPTIAFSIAVVAIWHLVQQWRRTHDGTVVTPTGPLGLDRADWLRLAVVFGFGLVHGLGFAGALGIEEPWSWTLLWSLLVFNVGIEVVQLSIILVVFPLLALLRKHASELGRWTGALVAAGVAVMGMVWFVERVTGTA